MFPGIPNDFFQKLIRKSPEKLLEFIQQPPGSRTFNTLKKKIKSLIKIDIDNSEIEYLERSVFFIFSRTSKPL